jgi:hypothetical protein
MTKKKNTLIRETLQTRLTPARLGEWLGKDAPAPGPFEPQSERGVGNDVVRALATGMLVMYPVAAIVVVVVATSLLLGLGTPT